MKNLGSTAIFGRISYLTHTFEPGMALWEAAAEVRIHCERVGRPEPILVVLGLSRRSARANQLQFDAQRFSVVKSKAG